jgi:indole-3-glycerol phosphate synthase
VTSVDPSPNSRASILQRILARKREEVDAARQAVPLGSLEALVKAQAPARDFVGALRAKHAEGRSAVIAEIKRASPSMGAIATDLDPAAVARAYADAHAACLSVLTDRDFFQGSPADLRAARAACALPVLRKDFIVDPYQLIEARAMGADAVLFIIDAAPIEAFQEMEKLAERLGLAVLIEVHTDQQFGTALSLNSPLIGVNNRDLHSFSVDIGRSLTCAARLPEGRLLVAESGISDRSQVETLRAAGIHTFLVGTALVREQHPGARLTDIFG